MAFGRKLARALTRRLADHFAIGSGYGDSIVRADSTVYTADQTSWTVDSG